jgi:uncharacterized protein YbjT (DUF2867 family)
MSAAAGARGADPDPPWHRTSGEPQEGTRVRVLVTGATGFVGGALVPVLLDAGYAVRCLVRDRARLTAPWRTQVEVVEGDAGRDQHVLRAADGTDVAVYLVHGMDGTTRDLVARERTAAAAFRDAVELAGVRRILYLGGLVDEDTLSTLSPHLYARHQTGVELAAGTVPVTELRAGIVLGAGSASLALLEAAARAPVALQAPWSSTLTQPIAVADLLALLLAVMEDPASVGSVLEVGGPEVLTYAGLVERVRTVLGLGPRPRLRLPYLPPEAVAVSAAARAGIPVPLALGLLPSAVHRAVVLDRTQRERYPWSGRTGVDAALADALGHVAGRG